MGVDFSPASDRALDRAADLAAELGASLAVVHAYEDPPGGLLEGEQAPLVQARLEESAAPLRTRYPSLRVDCMLRRGAAWDKLVNVACDLGAEMIVVGAGGEYSSGGPRFLGRVVPRVVATSNRSILVIPGHGRGRESSRE